MRINNDIWYSEEKVSEIVAEALDKYGSDALEQKVDYLNALVDVYHEDLVTTTASLTEQEDLFSEGVAYLELLHEEELSVVAAEAIHYTENEQPRGPEPITTWDDAAQNLLAQAQHIVFGDRQRTYGHPYEHHSRTATMWSLLFRTKVHPEQVSLAMIMDKLARSMHSPKPDNIVDIAGFSQVHAIVQDAKSRGEYR